jgi:integrase
MGRNRDDRQQIAVGIYRDAIRQYAVVSVRGAGLREKRFSLGESVAAIQKWRESTKAQLLDVADRGTMAGTFARDAKRYLKTFTTHLASWKSRRQEINLWVKLFGNRPRSTIRQADVAKVRMAWLDAGLKPKTVNNRVDSLRHMYRALDGKRAWTPCDELPKLFVHKTPMQFVTNETILAVDQRLQELERLPRQTKDAIVGPKVRARPSEIMRTEPSDLDMERRIWIPRDGKGGFSPGLYLNDDMLAAWQLFIDANAWGKYHTDRQAEALRRAGWPADVRPYNARHTLGITLSEGGTDLDDVGSMMGHKRRETTRRHYVPVLNSRMQKASESLAGRFKGWPEKA